MRPTSVILMIDCAYFSVCKSNIHLKIIQMGKSLQAELTESRIIVENTKKHVFIQQRMAPLGYDMPKINEG